METSPSSSSLLGSAAEPPASGPVWTGAQPAAPTGFEHGQITSLRIHRTECSGETRRYWVSAILDARYRLAGIRIVLCQETTMPDAERSVKVRVRLPGEELGGTFFQPVGAAACRALRHSLAAAFAERLALDAPTVQAPGGIRPGAERRVFATSHPRGERPRISTTHRKETR